MLPVACLVQAGVKKCFLLNLGDYKSNQVLVLMTRFFFVLLQKRQLITTRFNHGYK